MRRCVYMKQSRSPVGQHFTACPHPALPAQASLLSHPRIGCCLRHARPTRSSTGTACAASVVHLHPRIWLSRVQSCCRRQPPSASAVGLLRRRTPSASAVGELRRRAPSASSVGELRRRAPSASSVGVLGAPSVSSVGELRRRAPSASSVGLCRRPAPSALSRRPCAVGLRRRPAPSAYADSRVPSPPRSTDAILSHRSIDRDRVSATSAGHGPLCQQLAQYACPPAHFAAALQPLRSTAPAELPDLRIASRYLAAASAICRSQPAALASARASAALRS